MKRSLRLVLSIMLVIAFVVTSLGFAAITVKGLKLNASNIKLEVGKTYVLKTSFTPSNTTQKLLSYSTSSKSVATVDKNGVVKAVKVGKAVITVTSGSNKNVKTSCTVTVIANKVDKFVKMKLYMTGSEPQDTPAVMKEVNNYLKEKLNAELKMTIIPSADAGVKFPLLLASGEPIDMLFTAVWNFLAEATKGVYLPLTNEMLQKYAPNVWRDTTDMEWAIGTFNGKKYMVNKQEVEFDVLGFGYREDLRKKYNLPQLATWDNIELYLKTIKEKENMIPWDHKPHASEMFAISNALTDVRQFLFFDNINNKFILPSEHPEFVTYVNRMRKWYEAGYWSKNILSSNVDEKEAVKAGKTAIYMHNAATVASLALSVEDANKGIEMNFNAFNTLDGETVPVRKSSGKAGISLYYNCPNPERSLMFIDLVHSDPKLYRLMHYGIEGEHYAIDNGLRVLPAGKTQADIKYIDSYSIWGLRDNDMMIPLKSNWSKLDSINKGFEKNYTLNKLITFQFNDANVRTEIAAATNAWKTYGVPLINGTVDPVEGLKVLKQQLKNADIDKILKEYNDQYKK